MLENLQVLLSHATYVLQVESGAAEEGGLLPSQKSKWVVAVFLTLVTRRAETRISHVGSKRSSLSVTTASVVAATTMGNGRLHQLYHKKTRKRAFGLLAEKKYVDDATAEGVCKTAGISRNDDHCGGDCRKSQS